MRTYEQTLGAGETLRYRAGGYQFILLSCTSGVDVTFYKPNNQKIETAEGMTAGFQIRFEAGFGGVDLYSASAQTIKFGISNIADAEFNMMPDVAIASPSGLSTVADVTVNATTGLVLAANSNRKMAVISNLSTNPNAVRVGDSNAAAARGLELGIGETVQLETKAAIYVYSAGSSNIGVAYTE